MKERIYRFCKHFPKKVSVFIFCGKIMITLCFMIIQVYILIKLNACVPLHGGSDSWRYDGGKDCVNTRMRRTRPRLLANIPRLSAQCAHAGSCPQQADVSGPEQPQLGEHSHFHFPVFLKKQNIFFTLTLYRKRPSKMSIFFHRSIWNF